MTLTDATGQPTGIVPTNPRAVATDLRFHDNPVALYDLLEAGLVERMGADDGIAEARRIWADATRIAGNHGAAGGAS